MVCQVEILHRDMLSTAAEVCLDAAASQDGRRAPEDGLDGRSAPEDGKDGRHAPEDGQYYLEELLEEVE